MKKKISTEVAVLLLPPIFNQIEFNNNNEVLFLNLNEITNLDISSIYKDKKNGYPFLERMNQNDSAEKSIKIINSMIESRSNNGFDDLKVIFVNYPINKNQINNLKSSLSAIDLKISKVIILNLISFETLTDAKSKFFICSFCLNSYSREENFIDNEYVCPLDDQRFTSFQVNNFTDLFLEYYLENSLDVIQTFYKDEKITKTKIFALNIDGKENIGKNLKKDLFDIIENE